MRIKILYFTDKGKALAEKIKEGLSGHDAVIVPKGVPIAFVCGDAFADKEALVFVGAAGIAVRAIAPYVRDKLTDPPVIVTDENGNFVIPILSGHVGGANSLALEVAEVLEAQPVITTATDVSGAFSVDLFARENDLRIANREGIAKVSSSALEGWSEGPGEDSTLSEEVCDRHGVPQGAIVRRTQSVCRRDTAR